jgi:hypothetical protein
MKRTKSPEGVLVVAIYILGMSRNNLIERGYAGCCLRLSNPKASTHVLRMLSNKRDKREGDMNLNILLKFMQLCII